MGQRGRRPDAEGTERGDRAENDATHGLWTRLLLAAGPDGRRGVVLAQPGRAHPDHRVRLVEARIRRPWPVAPVEVDAEGASLLVPVRLVVAELALRTDVDREQPVVAVDARPRHEVVRESEPPRQAVLIDRLVVERAPVRATRGRVVH